MKSLLLHRLSVAEGETDTPNEWSIVEFKDKRSKTESLRKPMIIGSSSVLGLVLATHKNEKANVVERLEYESSDWEKNEKKIETKAMLTIEKDEFGKKEKSGKKQWGFSGFKKWKRKSSEDEEAPTPNPMQISSEMNHEFVDEFVPLEAVESNKQIKRKLQSEMSLEKVGTLSLN